MGIAWQDFILSRRTICSSEDNQMVYGHTAGQFVCWLADRGIDDPLEIRAIHARMYLDEFKVGGASEQLCAQPCPSGQDTRALPARGKVHPELIKFTMPPLSKQRLPYLKADEVTKVLQHVPEPARQSHHPADGGYRHSQS
jgi:hypothetical protein